MGEPAMSAPSSSSVLAPVAPVQPVPAPVIAAPSVIVSARAEPRRAG
jgi:hypothetical protein